MLGMLQAYGMGKGSVEEEPRRGDSPWPPTEVGLVAKNNRGF